MSNKKYVYAFAAIATLATLTAGTPALAQTATSTTPRSVWGANNPGKGNKRANFKPGVFGTVTAVSGNIITVTSKQRGFGATPETTTTTTATTTTYTIDATSATITKNNVAGNISSIVVGDTIMAQGNLTGTNLVATTIRDGQIGKGMHGQNGGAPGSSTSSQTSPITGNGQPVVAGTVTAISGASLTITNKSNVTYTIDTTNAKIVEDQNTITISSVAVGDMVVVQGTVSGNSVVASSVIDQKAATTTSTTTQPQSKGFFSGIGSFFSHLFGF